MESKFSRATSIKYHAIFDYKLTKEELTKWQYKREKPSVTGATNIKSKVRLQREKYSQQKLRIANRAAALISKIPSVKFVGITGSLAMMNSNRDSDIDLIIITSNSRLWTTRLLSYLVTWLLGFKTRKPESKYEKDRLCLNIWLDETDLVWDKTDRNIYTAHEIAQIVPLVNKDNTYEKFLYLNRWMLSFWPNSLKNVNWKFIENCELKTENSSRVVNLLEWMTYKLQYWYMSKKITREIVTSTRAIFHPNDWGKKVLTRLKAID